MNYFEFESVAMWDHKHVDLHEAKLFVLRTDMNREIPELGLNMRNDGAQMSNP